MGLETGTFVSDLVTANPPTTDLTSQGDDHLRLIKSVLQNTFPNASKAFYFPVTSAKSLDFTVTAANFNTTFLVTTTAGAITGTLPSLAAGDAGWYCYFMKVTTDLNALFIAPPTGTIQSGPVSGLAKTRRCIPSVSSKVFWTGSAWIAERAEKSPVGSIIDYDGSTLPVGYELPNGQTLSGTGGSVYPDFFAVKGSLVTRDVTGRVIAMKEASATRLTTAGSGVDGATLGSAGGAETNTLGATQIPLHQHSVFLKDNQHNHTATPTTNLFQTAAVQGAIQGISGTPGSVTVSTVGSNITIGSVNGVANDNQTAPTGGGLAHNNTQPVIVLNKLLVVE